MKVQLALIVATGLVSGPAAAQGSFGPGFKPSGFGSPASQQKPAPPSYGVSAPPTHGSAPQRSNSGGYAPIMGPPEAPGAKPYRPYTPGSVYAPPSRTMKPPCEQSVYANACDRQ